MSARELESALAADGIACSVEAHDALAVIVPRGDARDLADPDVRARVIELGRQHGFTHVAVELAPRPGGA